VCCLISLSVQAQSFVNLLGDSSLSQWTAPDGKPVTDGWKLQDDGTLHLAGKGGNIITARQYGDFELWFEFRIAKKGNSGIKYRVTHYGKQLLGCEYQILDDSAYSKSERKNMTASLYDVFEPIPAELKRFDDETTFNVGKVVVQNGRVRHWINGQLTVDERIGSADWDQAIANSKFANKENFGENHFGHIMLTDHGSEVWYRNGYIRSLDGSCCVCR
jgi:hypothetical protein